MYVEPRTYLIVSTVVSIHLIAAIHVFQCEKHAHSRNIKTALVQYAEFPKKTISQLV